MSKLPIIAITMGDPAGNGPELSVEALADTALYQRCRPLVVGDAKVLEAILSVAGHSELKIHRVKAVSEAFFEPGTIDVLHLELVDMAQYGGEPNHQKNRKSYALIASEKVQSKK